METLKKYWWIGAIVLGAILVLFLLRYNPDRQLRKQMERENKRSEQRIKSLEQEVVKLRKAEAKLLEDLGQRLKQDSIEDKMDSVEWNNLKKAYEKLKYKDLTDEQFDSIHNDILERAGYKK